MPFVGEHQNMVSAVRNGSVSAYLRILVIMTTFSNVIDVIKIKTQTIIISANLKPDFLHNMNGAIVTFLVKQDPIKLSASLKYFESN